MYIPHKSPAIHPWSCVELKLIDDLLGSSVEDLLMTTSTGVWIDLERCHQEQMNPCWRRVRQPGASGGERRRAARRQEEGGAPVGGCGAGRRESCQEEVRRQARREDECGVAMRLQRRTGEERRR